jgi:hypothetical protein
LGRLIAFPTVSSRRPEFGSFWPRLLTPTQAATYCGLTTSAFLKTCPVLPTTADRDAQCERFDRYELDAWIDRNGETSDQNGWLNWLALMAGKAS